MAELHAVNITASSQTVLLSDPLTRTAANGTQTVLMSDLINYYCQCLQVQSICTPLNSFVSDEQAARILCSHRTHKCLHARSFIWRVIAHIA